MSKPVTEAELVEMEAMAASYPDLDEHERAMLLAELLEPGRLPALIAEVRRLSEENTRMHQACKERDAENLDLFGQLETMAVEVRQKDAEIARLKIEVIRLDELADEAMQDREDVRRWAGLHPEERGGKS